MVNTEKYRPIPTEKYRLGITLKFTDPFYLIWMAMTKKILGEKKGYDRDGMTNFPSMETR